MRYVWIVLVLLLACVGSGKGPPHPHPEPLQEVLFHADTAFDPIQRDHIRHACTAWNLLSKGRAHLGVTFDLDFGDTSSILRSRYLPQIMAVESDYPTVIAVDLGSSAPVYGWTDMESRKVFLVMDRIPKDRFYSIALHEVGHTLRVQHSAGTRDVMSQYSAGREDFTVGDLEACRAVRVCP